MAIRRRVAMLLFDLPCFAPFQDLPLINCMQLWWGWGPHMLGTAWIYLCHHLWRACLRKKPTQERRIQKIYTKLLSHLSPTVQLNLKIFIKPPNYLNRELPFMFVQATLNWRSSLTNDNVLSSMHICFDLISFNCCLQGNIMSKGPQISTGMVVSEFLPSGTLLGTCEHTSANREAPS